MSDAIAVDPLEPVTVQIPAGGVLTITADEGSAGFAMRETGDGYKIMKLWVNAGIPAVVGPLPENSSFRIKTTKGTLRYALALPPGVVAQPEPEPTTTVAALEQTLPRATEIVKTGATIAKALNEGKAAMSLVDKMRGLADDAKKIPQQLSDRVDQVGARLANAAKRGHGALDGIEGIAADAEAAAQATEDAVNQLTNGGPLSTSS